MQDDSAFGEASTLGYTPSGAKIRGGNPMKEMWQKVKNWATPRLPFLPGAIFPILIIGIAIALPFLSPCLSDSDFLPETIQTLLEKISIEDMGAGGGRNLILIIGGCITWLFLYWRTVVANRNAEAAEQSAKASEQGVTVDRLAHATQQLAHKKVYVRMGGILGLEQIAEAPEEREKVAHILYTFLREHAKKDSKKSKNMTKQLSSTTKIYDQMLLLYSYRRERLDIEAATKTLARIVSKIRHQIPSNRRLYLLQDFSDTDLRGLQLDKIDLYYFNFASTDLRGAWLKETKFPLAVLASTDLKHANLSGADFQNAEGLTQDQLDQAYYWEDPPLNLPDGLKPPPERNFSKEQDNPEK